MIMKAVYQMVTFDFKHVQTLHTISQLPISVMSRDKELVQLYVTKTICCLTISF